MDKIDVGISKDDIMFLFKRLLNSGKLSESEYKKALDKLSVYRIHDSV